MKIQILGKNINYQIIEKQWLDEGKDLLVFLHEGLGSIEQWKDFPNKLSEKLQLPALVYDRIGYGESDYWEGDIAEKYLEFEAKIILPKLISSLNITNKIILFGHSDGGNISLLQCANPMPQLKAAIIEAPHVTLDNYSKNALIELRSKMNDDDWIHSLDIYHNGRANKLVYDWTSFWIKAHNKNWNIVSELKKIETPILLIQGFEDEFGTFEQIDTITKYINSKTIVVAKLHDCKHIPHLQQEEKTMEASVNFINKL